MKKKYLALSIVLPYYLFAQTTVLDDVNVTEKVEKATPSIKIDLEKKEQAQVNSFFDLFKKESSLEVGGGAINVQRVYIRGIESSNLNITLDGAKQGKNMFQHRGNELGINPDLLKTVDVKTRGDASKSSALAGSIEMTTKDAQDFIKGDKTKGVILKAGYNSNANTKLASMTTYENFDKNFGMYASVSGTNSNNYKDGNNDVVNATAYKDRDYLAKFSMLGVNDNDLRITVNQNQNSGNFQWGLSGSDTGVNTNPSLLEKIVSTTTNYSLQHTYNPSDLLNLDSNLNFTSVNIDREDKDLEYTNETITAKIQNHFDFDLAKSSNRVSIGAEFENQDGVGEFTPRADSYASQTKYSDISTQSKSLFIQNKTSLGDLDIHYGLRFDDYDFETGLGKATDSTFSPNIGFDYALNENSKIYASYDKNSRMSGIIPFTWMNHILINKTYSSDLEAEKSQKYELGYEYQKNNILLDDDFMNFNMSIFQTKIADLIIAEDVNGGTEEGGRTLVDIYNSPNDYESKGFELKLSYNYDRYFSSFSYTQIDANTVNDSTSSLSGIDESIIIRRVGTYDSKKFVLNTGVELTNNLYADYTLNAIKGIEEPIERSGYVTHDVSTKYKPSTNSSWTYYAAINNITNKSYASHSTIASSSNADIYRLEAGRDFRFTVKYEF